MFWKAQSLEKRTKNFLPIPTLGKWILQQPLENRSELVSRLNNRRLPRTLVSHCNSESPSEERLARLDIG